MTNKQKVKSNEQKVTGYEQKVTIKGQTVTTNDLKRISNKQRGRSEEH